MHSDGGAHNQSPARIESGVREGLKHVDVLAGYQTAQTMGIIPDDQFFHPVLVEQSCCLREAGARRGGNQILCGHHLSHGLFVRLSKGSVATGQNAHHGFPLDDGQTGDAHCAHDFPRLAQACSGGQGHRILNHSVGGSFDFVHLDHLLFDAEIAVNDANAPFPCKGHRQTPFGHRVHGRRTQRNVHLHTAAKARDKADLAGQHIRVHGRQEDIVKSQGQGDFGHGAV